MMLAALPMVIYAIQRPDIFFNRLAEVTGGDSITIAESILLHVQMFFLKGDPYLRYNIPGRPYMTLIEGVLLVAGQAAGTWRYQRKGSTLQIAVQPFRKPSKRLAGQVERTSAQIAAFFGAKEGEVTWADGVYST